MARGSLLDIRRSPEEMGELGERGNNETVVYLKLFLFRLNRIPLSRRQFHSAKGREQMPQNTL